MKTILIALMILSGIHFASAADDTAQSTICFSHELPNQLPVSLIGTSKTACAKISHLGEALPAETLINIVLTTRGSFVTVLRNVRQVKQIHFDESSGTLSIQSVNFKGCGSDCIYDTETTTIKGLTTTADLSKNLSALDVQTVLNETELGNFY